MQIKLLTDIVVHVAGQQAGKIVELLYGKQNVNEFEIAKKLKITINQARNILYKLGDEGIVSFTRKKDKKNGGWYTYFWTLDVGRSLFVLKTKLLHEIESVQSNLSGKKNKNFYFCPNCGMEVTEESALTYDFTCPECGEIFQLKDNSGEIKKLEMDIQKLQETLALVDKELEEIGKKEETVKGRRLKNEARKKLAERRARKVERDKLKGKVVKVKVVKSKVNVKKMKRIIENMSSRKKIAKKKRKG